MKLDHKIREAETRLFARGGLQPEESFLDLDSAKVWPRVLSVGAGPPLVMRTPTGASRRRCTPLLSEPRRRLVTQARAAGQLRRTSPGRASATELQRLTLVEDLTN
jgi:hypothetical protein